MNLKTLKNLNRHDVLAGALARLGLQTKSSDSGRMLGALGIFGVGLLVGAGVALLLAPKPGRELRQELRAKVGGAPATDLANGAAADVAIRRA